MNLLVLNRKEIELFPLILRKIGLAEFYWEPSPKEDAVTFYHLQKSTDGGITFQAMVSIANSTTDPAYSPEKRVFFYLDPIPVTGEIVRLRAETLGPVYTKWSYCFSPQKTQETCTLYFSLYDSISGKALSDRIIVITVLKAPEVSDFNVPAITNRGSIFSDNQRRTVRTDENGMAQIDLIHGAFVEVNIIQLGKTLKFRVPSKDILNFADADRFGIYDLEHHPGRT